MFVRCKKNSSGSSSVQIIKKEAGKYIVVETIGCSDDPEQLAYLQLTAKNRIIELRPQTSFNFNNSEQILALEYLDKATKVNVLTIGPELVLGKIFDQIGFNIIKNELFRDIVIARLVYPVSKLKTIDYLLQHKQTTIEISKLYRFLDKFHKDYKTIVEDTAFHHTQKILHNISVVFYDMTTLYFESEDEDDLRKIGFSKDGKFQHPQIMLGLLVGENGFPIGYDIFEGNTFEGNTLVPVIERLQAKYNLQKPIIVADSALLSQKNISTLHNKQYQFILGARIKNENSIITNQILEKSKKLQDSEIIVIDKPDNTRLIISYSTKRAKKDASNRQKGLNRLLLKFKSGKLTKKSINNRGYNKFLSLSGKISVELDQNKILQDSLWDGLKGYVTNSDLDPKQVINNYQNLWKIEKAFRISKTDLRIRPIFHRKKDRIEAHICISFAAYTIYKELERILYNKKINISPQKAIELTKTIYKITYQLPGLDTSRNIFSTLTAEQKIIMDLF